MRRLLLPFFMFSLLYIVSSCTIPVEPSPQMQVVVVPEDAVQPSPVLPAVEAPLQEAVDGVANEKAVQKPEIFYPYLGSKDAPVTVTEYGDFSDRVSSEAAISQISSIKRDYVVSNKVKLVFKPYPLGSNEEARLASEASWCMWEQGSSSFWSYYSTLFTFYTHLDEASLKNYASRTQNADKAAFVKCLDSGRYAGVVESTLDEGRQSGFTEVPVFVIGEQVFTGVVSYKKLKAAIEEELNSEGGNAITGNVVLSQKALYGIPEKIIRFISKI